MVSRIYTYQFRLYALLIQDWRRGAGRRLFDLHAECTVRFFVAVRAIKSACT